MIYLDNGATTLRKPPQVARAVLHAMEHYASPGRGGYPAAMAAADAVYRCRELAGILFDAEPESVVFTMNATHGLNVALKSLIGPGDTVVVSGFEHNAVMRPLYAIGARVIVAGRKLFDEADTLREFDNAITLRTRAVVCTHVSNVFGYRLPIERIAALCAKRSVPLIVDASQSAGVLPLDMTALGAAFLAMPGHKGLYGPQGTGVLVCGEGVPVRTLLEGGTGSMSIQQHMPDFLPDRLEAGTHNMPGIAGLLAGVRYVQERGEAAICRHERELAQMAVKDLQKLNGVQVFALPDLRAQTGVVSFRMEGRDAEDVGASLAAEDIAVRAGLHCAPLAHRSAGTLETGTVRVSVSDFNTPGEITHLIAAVKALIS